MKFLLFILSYVLIFNSRGINGALKYVQSKYGILKPQQKAVSGFYKTLPATSPQECGAFCTMDSSCLGYSFRVRNIDTNISQPCELSNDRSTTFEPNEEFDYYSSCITDLKTCKSQGTCEAIMNNDGTVKGYYCFCDTLAPRSACQFSCIIEEVPGYDIYLNDAGDEVGVSYEDRAKCGEKCAKNRPNCQAAAHSLSHSQCFFKSESQYTSPGAFIQKGGATLFQLKCNSGP